MKLDALVQALAADVERGLEENVLEACRLRLGQDVAPEELAKRLGVYAKDDGDFYYLDGVLLAFVGPIEVMDGAQGMTASRLFIRYKADGAQEPQAAANDEASEYERDLETVSRIEAQIVEQGGQPADVEFFGAMGAAARARTEGSTE